MLARLLTLPSTWWSRVRRAKGGARLAWLGLPLVGICLCCGMFQTAGQSAGLLDIPPTRTPGPTATARPTDAPRPTPREPSPTRAPLPTNPPLPTDVASEPTSPPAPAPTEASPPAAADPPAAAPAVTGPVAPVGDDCPPEALIKGNQGDEWIYHVPGGRSYSRTSPEQCFATEADARNAGYRAAQN